MQRTEGRSASYVYLALAHDGLAMGNFDMSMSDRPGPVQDQHRYSRRSAVRASHFQMPVKVGARFSAKALIPSAKSPEPAISLWVCASNSNWSSICSYSHLFNSRLVPA